jgi:hypothetical protein
MSEGLANRSWTARKGTPAGSDCDPADRPNPHQEARWSAANADQKAGGEAMEAVPRSPSLRPDLVALSQESIYNVGVDNAAAGS